MNHVQYVVMRETHMIIQAHLPKLCIVYLPFIHVINRCILVHNPKCCSP